MSNSSMGGSPIGHCHPRDEQTGSWEALGNLATLKRFGVPAVLELGGWLCVVSLRGPRGLSSDEAEVSDASQAAVGLAPRRSLRPAADDKEGAETGVPQLGLISFELGYNSV